MAKNRDKKKPQNSQSHNNSPKTDNPQSAKKANDQTNAKEQ